eukprot:6202842-Pleurochrysis_carterae.AAC.4
MPRSHVALRAKAPGGAARAQQTSLEDARHVVDESERQAPVAEKRVAQRTAHARAQGLRRGAHGYGLLVTRAREGTRTLAGESASGQRQLPLGPSCALHSLRKDGKGAFKRVKWPISLLPSSLSAHRLDAFGRVEPAEPAHASNAR